MGIRTNERVNRANAQVRVLAERDGFAYIDVNEGLTDAEESPLASIFLSYLEEENGKICM